MQNSKAILLVAVSVVVAVGAVVGLRVLPEDPSRQADKALGASVDKATALYDTAETLLDNPIVENVKNPKAPVRGPWVKGVSDPGELSFPSEEWKRDFAAAKGEKDAAKALELWDKLVNDPKVRYRMSSEPLVHPDGYPKLEAAEKILKEALSANAAKANLAAAILCRLRLGSVELLQAGYGLRQANLSRREVYRLLSEAEAALEEMARDRERVDYYKKANETVAKGADAKWLEATRARKQDLMAKLAEAKEQAKNLQASMEKSQNESALLRKQADEGRIQVENVSGPEGIRITETVIENLRKAGEADVAAEGFERQLNETNREIARLMVDDAYADEDLSREARNEGGRQDYGKAAETRIAGINERVKRQKAQVKAMLTEVCSRIFDKAYVAAATGEAASKPAPAAVGQGVPGVDISEAQARQALEAATKELVGIDAVLKGKKMPEVKVAQATAYMARGRLMLDGIGLLERIQSVLAMVAQANQASPGEEIDLGDAKARLEGYLASRKSGQPVAETGPAAVAANDLNVLRKQAADAFMEAARRFGQAENDMTDGKLRWAYSTLAGLAWEKQYSLLRGIENPAADVQNELAEARKNAEESVKKALQGREGSPFLAAANSLKARLDAVKPAP